MTTALPPLEFSDCLVDSPFFRDNLHLHEKELERTSHQIKRLEKEVKDLIIAAKNLSIAQRKLSKSLENFSFAGVETTQTDDERVIQESLKEFGALIAKIEDVRERILECAYDQIIIPLENFRKEKIGKVKEGKKKFEKQTAKFCQSQERYLNLSTKKQDSQLKEADATLDMEERELCQASLHYVFLLQEVEERKKFEFVETLLSFLFNWLAFYHQGHDVYGEFTPYMTELQLKIQKTRENFNATRDKTKSLMQKMLEMRQQKPLDPTIVKSSFTREGYLFLQEKKAFGATWTKQYCRYKKDTKEFEMIPFHQLTTKTVNPSEKIKLASCTRRMSDTIEKRFCFDIISADKPNVVYTLQALSEADRKLWMDAMDGKEPTYVTPGNLSKTEERQLDEAGISFIKKCIEVIESRGLEEQGLYRIVGVNSKVNKLISMVLDRRKAEKLNLDDPYEWESKTLTSALKNFLRNLPEPLMTYKLHESFIESAKKSSNTLRVNSVHALVYKLPQPNFQILDLLIKHLSNVAAKSDKNLMSVSNLGVCFGPTLLRPEEETVAAILNIKFCNIVVEILIENYEKIFKHLPNFKDNTETSAQPQSSTRELTQKFNQQSQVSYSHLGSSGSGGGSSQGSSSSAPSIRAPPRHQFIGHQNPVTHTVIKTFYNDKPTSVNLSSSVSNVQSLGRDREFSTDRSEQNSSASETNSASNFWPSSITNRVSSVTTFSESNLHSLNKHSNYEHLTQGRPRYQFSSADRGNILKMKLDMGKSSSPAQLIPCHASGEQLRERGRVKPSSSTPTLRRRGKRRAGILRSFRNLRNWACSGISPESTKTFTSERSDLLNSNSSSNESVSSKDGQDINYYCLDGLSKNHFLGETCHDTDFYKKSMNFEKEDDSYSTLELYKSSSGGIPQKGLRNLGVHPLPLYRPQPDNVVPFSYSSDTPSVTLSRNDSNVRRVRTLFACLGENDGELSFDPNQIITNVRPSQEPGWLEGTLNGKTGLIPENYVEILP